MLLELEPDQAFLRDTTARFLSERADSRAVRALRDHPDGFERDYWRDGVQLGWTHLLVTEHLGGGSVSTNGLVDLTLIAHEFGRRAAPGPLLVSAVATGALADADAHHDVVKGVLAGDLVATWAAPPSDAVAPVTARVVGTDVVLDGSLRPVESAATADVAVITAAGPDGPLQVLVPTDAPGVSIDPLRSVDLTRRFSAMGFDGVRLPSSTVVGPTEPELAAASGREQRLRALVLCAAESVGAMDSAFAMTLEWTRDRFSFGRPLSSYQAIKHRMALMKTWLEASHAIADEAAFAVATRAGDAAKLAHAAAAYVGEQGSELLQECVQLHGGIGVTYEHDLHLFLRRQSLNRNLLGTPARHRRHVTQELRRELVLTGVSGP